MILKKKKLILISVAIMVIFLWFLTFLSPEWTIRRHILTSLQPINSLTADITTMGRVDVEYGYLYNVSGYMHRPTGDELGVVYLKKLGPFWYVASVGTGP
ncbi:hypothetical protein [Bacillus sp. FJAT-28004]|uniref:hypothetical protein n=1 Tax=Bacillus sp. FJAT-28004 TaxID=1679165 RepID=UPI0006B5F494|nr:hypothetical protein [Bacillus sp. FJAT-28004]